MIQSKPKCPVCQQDLGIILCDLDDFFCPRCKMWGSEKLWKVLIRTQKQLEIARKALEEIDTTRCIPQQTLISLGKLSKTTRFNAGNIICVATHDYIHNTLEQIKHKEQK